MLHKSSLETEQGDGLAPIGLALADGASEAVDPFAGIPLIDDARLGRLRAMIPTDAFGAIVQSYIDSDFFAGLEDAPPADDPEFSGMVHDCKGTSANIGASRLRVVAERLELACHTGDRGAVLWLFPELRRVGALTRQALASRVTDPASAGRGGAVRPQFDPPPGR